MQEPRTRAGIKRHVDIGIFTPFAFRPCADFQHQRIPGAAILQMMAILVPGVEPGAIAWLQNFLAIVGDQHDLAGQDIDELILFGVPMTLAGPDPRWQAQKIDAELGQTGGVAQFLSDAGAAGFVERRRVKRADDLVRWTKSRGERPRPTAEG